MRLSQLCAGVVAAMVASRVLLHAAGAIPAPLDPQSASELTIKSAFLNTFPKFVEWPESAFASPSEPFVVATLGDDPLAAVVPAAMRGTRIGGRTVTVLEFSRVDDLRPCHMLYIADSEERRLGAVMSRLSGTPTLTVGSFGRFAAEGGMIRLFVQNGKIRFAINNRAAGLAGLRLSSRLLSLASEIVSIDGH